MEPEATSSQRSEPSAPGECTSGTPGGCISGTRPVQAVPQVPSALFSEVLTQARRRRPGLREVVGSKDKPVSVPVSFTTRSLREEVWTPESAQHGAAVQACGEKSARVALDRGESLPPGVVTLTPPSDPRKDQVCGGKRRNTLTAGSRASSASARRRTARWTTRRQVRPGACLRAPWVRGPLLGLVHVGGMGWGVVLSMSHAAGL